MILLDTSILIEFFRKENKKRTIMSKLSKDGFEFCTSAITKYEIYCGVTSAQRLFWDNLFAKIYVLPFDDFCVDQAVTINNQLKKKSKQIDLADLFIAATAQNLNIPLATLNLKHFERVDGLEILP